MRQVAEDRLKVSTIEGTHEMVWIFDIGFPRMHPANGRGRPQFGRLNAVANGAALVSDVHAIHEGIRPC
jgi:hypothetical protein